MKNDGKIIYCRNCGNEMEVSTECGLCQTCLVGIGKIIREDRELTTHWTDDKEKKREDN